MEPLEIIGTLFGLCYVVLAIYQNRLCWPAAVASAVCYIFVFFNSELFTQAFLQIFFITLGIHGYLKWQDSSKSQLPVTTQTIRDHTIGITVTALASIILGYIIETQTKADFIYLDSAITCFSIYTTWLVTRKILESWLYWIIIDIIAAGLYLYKELYLTSALYMLYCLMAIFGYIAWKKE